MMSSPPEMYVHALYNFDYETEDGKKVSMREGEEFLLLKKTNGDWWQVIRDGERRPFYAPANYVQEIEQPLLLTANSTTGPTPPRRPLLLHAKSRSASCASVGPTYLPATPSAAPSQLRHSASSAQELASAARSLRGHRGSVAAVPAPGSKRLPHFRFEAIDVGASENSTATTTTTTKPPRSALKPARPIHVAGESGDANGKQTAAETTTSTILNGSSSSSNHHHHHHHQSAITILNNDSNGGSTPSPKTTPNHSSMARVSASPTLNVSVSSPKLLASNNNNNNRSANDSPVFLNSSASSPALSRLSSSSIVSNPSPVSATGAVTTKRSGGNRSASESSREHAGNNDVTATSRAPSPAVRSLAAVTSVVSPPVEHSRLLGRAGSPASIGRPATPSRFVAVTSSSSSEDLIDSTTPSPVTKSGKDIVVLVDNRAFATDEGDKNRRNQVHLQQDQPRHHHHNGNVNNNDVIVDNNNGSAHVHLKAKRALSAQPRPLSSKPPPEPDRKPDITAPPPSKQDRKLELPTKKERKVEPLTSATPLITTTSAKTERGEAKSAAQLAHQRRSMPPGGKGTESRLTPERGTPPNSLKPRPPSPIYANFPLLTSPVPPSPESRQFPLRNLDGDWAEFEDAQGRKYYYNSVTHDKSWKPPRRRSSNSKPSSETASPSGGSPQMPEPDSDSDERADAHQEALHSPTPESLQMPPGWTRSYDSEVGEMCYVNDLSKTKWYMSTDECGRVYYYQENAQESFWQLPEVVIAQTESGVGKDKSSSTSTTSTVSSTLGSRILEEVSPSSLHRTTSANSPPKSISPRRRPKSLADRGSKARSAYFSESKFSLGEDSICEAGPVRSSTLPKSLTCHNVNMIQKVIMQGILFKTKLSESGKKLRKNWSSSNVILTERALYLFKDFKPLKDNSPNKSEVSIELSGAQIEWTPDKSSRKNVFQITALADTQLLFQDDEAQNAKKWFETIYSIIEKLPSEPFVPLAVLPPKPGDLTEPIKSGRLMRRSTKRVDAKGSGSSSTEDLDTSTQVEKKSKIRDKLRMFFIRRPTVESLREKGIYEEGPVFGSDLQTVCSKEKANVPKFVVKCISAIEEKDMTADGLYRASGNLSQVQKIRFKINQDNYDILIVEEDVHVLTGALKMFFRELKEPLFPCKMFDSFLKAMDVPDRAGKIVAFRDLISSLPRPNYCTLKYLLEHLLKVTEYHDQNRMHVQNLAIVFGPTLMWSGSNLANIANDVIHQNQIIEFLLLEFTSIFR